MKGCELCRQTARTFCEADGASLCWECDEKVHSANFLVAKHSRTLLCHACQSPTPWNSSGTKLPPLTVSVCHTCVHNYYCTSNTTAAQKQGIAAAAEDTCNETDTDDEVIAGYQDNFTADEQEEEEYSSDDHEFEEEEEYSSDDHEFEEEEEEEEADDGENQVVPWSSVPPSPPPVASSSSTEEEVSGFKRRRDYAEDLDSEDEIGSISSRSVTMTSNSEALESYKAIPIGFSRPQKQLRPNAEFQSKMKINQGDTESRSRSSVGVVISSLKKLNRKAVVSPEDNHASSSTILAICRMSRDPAPL